MLEGRAFRTCFAHKGGGLTNDVSALIKGPKRPFMCSAI